ncbi:hypothetical protein SDC9_46818 [bioreactor metagenome]|uniref:Uncharacterized protein n=1 Tax=bioreactor metagenome TaxID=1076179 RepID=A0A644WAT9_9ZZZZ
MNKLKELLKTGNDEQILNYVKNDLAPNIDTYVETVKEVPKLQNELTKLQIESIKRQIEIEEYKKKVDQAIAKLNTK